jgi:FlaG/FlaF family flagellin (archaellin)
MAQRGFWRLERLGLMVLAAVWLVGLGNPTWAQSYFPTSTGTVQFRGSYASDLLVWVANAQGEPITVALNKLIFWDLTRGDETLTIRAVQQGSQESLLRFTGAATLDSQNTISATKAAALDSTGLAYLAALRIDTKVEIAGASLTKTGSGSAVLFREVSGSGALNVNGGL